MVHIQTHTATVLCICNPARIFTCLMTLAVTWPEQILSTHPRPMICNDNYGSQQVYRGVPSIFFTTCRPRLFHWSKPSETSLAHLHWVMWCPSLCVVEAFVKGRWTTSPCTIITHTSFTDPGVSHCKCVRGFLFLFFFLSKCKRPHRLVILLLKHVPLSSVSSKSEAPGTTVYFCMQYLK